MQQEGDGCAELAEEARALDDRLVDLLPALGLDLVPLQVHRRLEETRALLGRDDIYSR